MNNEESSTSTSVNREARLAAIRAQVSGVGAVAGTGGEAAAMRPNDGMLDEDDPVLKGELVRIVVQYLESAGYVASALTLADELFDARADIDELLEDQTGKLKEVASQSTSQRPSSGSSGASDDGERKVSR